MTATIETDTIRIEIDFTTCKVQTEQHYEKEVFDIEEMRLDGHRFILADGVPDCFVDAMNERMEYQGDLEEN